MSDETISALLAKRTELAEQVQHIQATIFHLDAALEAFGYRRAGQSLSGALPMAN
jgi:hypothetical protein